MFTDDQGQTRETKEEMSIERKLDLIIDSMKRVEAGFPKNEDGTPDVEGHRKFHEAKIRAAEAEENFWRELKLDIAKKGAWGLLVIVVGLVLTGFMAKTGFVLK
jgi:hypothetical protein